MDYALTEASAVRDFLIQFSGLFEPAAMLLIFILSVRALKASRKKVYLLFIVTALGLSISGIIQQIDNKMREKHQLSLSCIVFGRDYRTNLPSEEFRTLTIEKKTRLQEYKEKETHLEKKLVDGIKDRTESKPAWLGELWANLATIFRYWLLPLSVIFICLADIKSNKGSFSLFKKKK